MPVTGGRGTAVCSHVLQHVACSSLVEPNPTYLMNYSTVGACLLTLCAHCFILSCQYAIVDARGKASAPSTASITRPLRVLEAEVPSGMSMHGSRM
jgi:hypothetical protein